MTDKKPNRKKPQCARCKRKLVTVFIICRCKQLFCRDCSIPSHHSCERLEEFIEAEAPVFS